MLQRTFLHLSGVGEATEQRIWRSGIRDWNEFISAHERGFFSGRRIERSIQEVEESLRRFQKQDWAYFDQKLPSPHKWRAYDDLRDRVLYVDIETTGLSGDNAITVIGTYNGWEVKAFVADQNLDEALAEIEQYPLLVTFNGAQFDLPLIRAQFRCGLFSHIHIDLRYPLKRLGFTGGLKRIERTLGIERSENTRGLDGWDAVRLWREYQNGSREALQLLLKYNSEDIVNLEPLLQLVQQEMGRRYNELFGPGHELKKAGPLFLPG